MRLDPARGAGRARGLALPGAARARIYADTVNMVGESLDEIRAKGRLEVAVYEDFAPFSAARDGRLAGIDCDIARLIAERLGVAARAELGPGRARRSRTTCATTSGAAASSTARS